MVRVPARRAGGWTGMCPDAARSAAMPETCHDPQKLDLTVIRR
jgi:hypothetical protein